MSMVKPVKKISVSFVVWNTGKIYNEVNSGRFKTGSDGIILFTKTQMWIRAFVFLSLFLKFFYNASHFIY